MLGHGDLHRGLELRPGVEELEKPFLDLTMRASHELRQLSPVHHRRPTAAGALRLVEKIEAVGWGGRVGEMKGEPLDPTEGALCGLIGRSIGFHRWVGDLAVARSGGELNCVYITLWKGHVAGYYWPNCYFRRCFFGALFYFRMGTF